MSINAFAWSRLRGGSCFLVPQAEALAAAADHLAAAAPVALGVLAVAGLLEGYSCFVAWNELKREAKKAGMSTWEYIVDGPDPVNVAVFLEDAIAVGGVLVASAGIGLTVRVYVCVIIIIIREGERQHASHANDADDANTSAIAGRSNDSVIAYQVQIATSEPCALSLVCGSAGDDRQRGVRRIGVHRRGAAHGRRLHLRHRKKPQAPWPVGKQRHAAAASTHREIAYPPCTCVCLGCECAHLQGLGP